MDREQARQVLNDKIDELLALGHTALGERAPRAWRLFGVLLSIGDDVAFEQRRGPSGAVYELATQVAWDDKPGHELLIEVEIIDHTCDAADWLGEELVLAPTGQVTRRWPDRS